MQRLLCLTLLLTFGLAWPALASHPDTKTEIENLKARIQALEAEVADGQPEERPFTLAALDRHLTFGGLFELEASWTDPEQGASSSDLTLATAQLSLEAEATENIGGHLILLYEEDPDNPDDETVKVDEAVISLGCPKPLFGQKASLHGGKLYLPFGKFNSYMVSDPLTLELGETADTALVLGLEGDLWTASLGVFNGGTDAVGDEDHIDTLVAALEITPRDNLVFGVSYISDLAESDNGLVADASLYSDSVPGASAFVSATFGPFGLEAEILGALDDFDTGLVNHPNGTDLTGTKPLTWNLEASWQATEKLQLAARLEGANDFQDDITRYGVAGSYGLFRNTVLALELLHADADNGGDADSATAQLAFEF